MSRIVDTLTVAGATIEEALRQIVDANDTALQLGALRRELKTEKTISDGRWETVGMKLDELDAKVDRSNGELKQRLDHIITLLTTNGTGGHNG